MIERSRYHCTFCDEIRDKELPADLHAYTELTNRFVDESDGFVAFPSVAPLRPGHLLLAPKFHITSMLQVTPPETRALDQMVQRLVGRMSKLYGEIMFFEHGVGSGKSGGCGIDHAHWHLIPCNEVEAARITNIVAREYPSLAVSNISRIREETALGSSYLLFGRSFDQVHYSVDNNFESQYLRRIAADVFGCAEWDWRTLGGWKILEDTYSALVTNSIHEPRRVGA